MPAATGPLGRVWRHLLAGELNDQPGPLSIYAVFPYDTRVRVRAMPMAPAPARLFAVHIERDDDIYDEKLVHLHRLLGNGVRKPTMVAVKPVRVCTAHLIQFRQQQRASVMAICNCIKMCSSPTVSRVHYGTRWPKGDG